MTGNSTLYDMRSWQVETEYRSSSVPIGGWIPLVDRHSPFHVGTGRQYLTIQEAVDAARPQATIVIHPGTYDESVVVDKAIHLRSSGDIEATIVTSSWETVSDVVVSGITFFVSFDVSAIRVLSGRITVSDCVFVGRRSEKRQSSGITFGENVARPMIYNSRFTSWHQAVDFTSATVDGVVVGNVFEGNERALVIYSAVRLTVERNVFLENFCAFHLLDELGLSRNITIQNNVFDSNGKTLRHLVWSTNGTREKTDARQNYWVQGKPGIAASYGRDGDIDPNSEAPQGFVVNPILDTIPPAITLPPIYALSTSGRCDVRWTGKQWFVRPDAFSRAIAVAPPHSVLLLNPGTYRGYVVVNKSVTVVAVEQCPETNFYGQFVITRGAHVTIKGLVIRGERGNAIILQDPGSVLTLQKCKFFYDTKSPESSSVAVEVQSDGNSTILVLDNARFTGWSSAFRVAGSGSTISIQRTEFQDCDKIVDVADPARVSFIENTVSHCREGIVLHSSGTVQSLYNISRNNFYEVARTISLFGKTWTHLWTTEKNFWFPDSTLSVSVLRADESVDHVTSGSLGRLLRLHQSGTKNAVTPTVSSSSIDMDSGTTVAFQSVQDAVAFAHLWDTVVVLPGVYDNAHVHINKPLKLVGDTSPILLGAVRISHSHVVLSGLVVVRFNPNKKHNHSHVINIDLGVSHVALYDMNVDGSNNHTDHGIIAGGGNSVGIGLFSTVFQQLPTALFIRESTLDVAVEGNTFTLCDRAVVISPNCSGRVEGNEFQNGCHLVIMVHGHVSTPRILVRYNNFFGSSIIYQGRKEAKELAVDTTQNYWSDYHNTTKSKIRMGSLPLSAMAQPVNVSSYGRFAGACFTYSGVQTADSCHGMNNSLIDVFNAFCDPLVVS